MIVKKANNYIRKNAVCITVYTIVTGVIFTILLNQQYIFNIKLNDAVITFLKIIDYNFLNIESYKFNTLSLKKHLPDSNLDSVLYLNYLFYSVFILGLVIYYASKKKETRILSFCFSMIFINLLFLQIVDILTICFMWSEFHIFWLLSFFKHLVVLYICYVLTLNFNLESISKLNPLIKSNRITNIASLHQRFFHFVYDTMFIFTLTFYYAFYNKLLSGFKDWLILHSTNWIAYIVLLVLFSAFYYLIFEGLFMQTPFKMITNTRLISTGKSKIKFSNLIIRTLARRIPFNALSFFKNYDWHDRLSNTTVVNKEKNEKKYYSFYLLIFVILTFVFLIPIFELIFTYFNLI